MSNNDTGARVTNWNMFFKGFKMPMDGDKQLSIPHRVAYLLHWAAGKGAGTVIPYNIVYKFVFGVPSTPRSTNEDVLLLRKKLPAARPILQSKYKRDLRSVSPIGVRATTNDLDVVKSTTIRVVKRVNSAHEALRKNAALVNPNKLPDHGPDKPIRDWYLKTVTPALKMLSDERIAKLLPPKPPKSEAAKVEDDDNGKSK